MSNPEVRVKEVFDNHEVPLAPVAEKVLNKYRLRISKAFNIDSKELCIVVSTPGFQAIHVLVYQRGKEFGVASFDLEQCPGCCAVGITSFMRLADMNEKKLNFMTDIREQIAKKAKWGVLIATLTEHQSAENAVLKTRGWGNTPMFFNPKTGNGVYIWRKDLTHAFDMR